MKIFFLIVMFSLPAGRAGEGLYAQNNKPLEKSGKIDSLLHVLKTSVNDTSKINALNELSKLYRLKANFTEARDRATEAIDLSEKLIVSKNSTVVYFGERNYAAACVNYGVACTNLSDYGNALAFYEKALTWYKKAGDKKQIGAVYGNIGIVYKFKSDFPKALEYYFMALKIAEEQNDKEACMRHYNNIANTHRSLREYPEALQFFLKALKLSEALKDKNAGANILGNIGIVLGRQGNYQEALNYLFKSLSAAEQMGSKNDIGIRLSNIASIYIDQGDSAIKKNNKEYAYKDRFPKAEQFYLRALKTGEETGNKKTIALSMAHVGAAYLAMQKFSEAETYLKKASSLAKEISSAEIMKEATQHLYELFETQKKYEQAFEYYKNYISARDSLFNEANAKKNVEIEMNYDFAKKETAAKAAQEKKDLKNSEEKHKQQIILWFTVSGLGIVLILAVIILRSLILNKKKNKIISAQKELVEMQKHIVEEKQKEILDSIYYARRIQRALITNEKYIERKLKEMYKKDSH